MEHEFEARLQQARWAVRRWEELPVARQPRPLVFAGPVVLSERGFPTGEAKDAWFAGDYEWAGRSSGGRSSESQAER